MVIEKGGIHNMNKKLLFVLPLFIVLPFCSHNNLIINNKDIIKEDTTLHEEIFGDNGIAYDLNNYRQPRKLASDLVEPPIGVQYKYYEDGGNNYFAVRYVAAIKSLDVTATWTRAAVDKNGTQTKSLDHVEATKAYRTLNDGGDISTCASQYPGFEYYVVYTMYDIPDKLNRGDIYLMAYLTLSYGEETPVNSHGIVTQIKGTGLTFSFDVDSVTNNYFIDIHRNSGDDDIYYASAGTPNLDNPAQTDLAKFTENMSFSNKDTFGIFKLSTTEFKFYDFTTVSNTAGRFISLGGSKEQYSKFILNGSYHFYINYEDKIYVSPSDLELTFYLVPNDNWNQEGDSHAPRFALYAFDNNDHHTWVNMTLKAGESNVYQANINIGTYPSIKFVRMNGNNEVNDWSNKYNETGNLDIVDTSNNSGPSTITFTKYSLSVGAWDGNNGTWGA